MTTDYSKYPLLKQAKIALGEQQHATQITQAIDMWSAALYLINECADNLNRVQQDLADAWPDFAGTAVAQTIERSRTILRTWSGNISAKPGILTVLQDIAGTHGNGLLAQVQVDAVWECEQYKENNYPPLLEYAPPSAALGKSLNALAQAYESAVKHMANAVSGPDWEGPRRVSGQPGVSDSPAPTDSGAGRPTASAGPAPASAPGPGDPGRPAGPDQPGDAEDGKDLLDQSTQAVDSLSQAAQSLQQLLGGAAPSLSGLTPTTGDFNPATLGSMSPADLTNHLDHLGNASGLPTLAGLGGAGGVGGGLGGGLGGGAGPGGFDPGMGASLPGPNSPAATGMSGSAAAATPIAAAGTAAADSRGMMPMYPPRTAGARTSGEIKPGDAEDVNTGRARAPGGTPGVSLRGRAGKGRPARPAPAAGTRPHPATGEATDQLLDEELWHVNREDNHQRRVTWPQQK